MTVLTDLRNEIHNYAADFVTLDIRDWVSEPAFNVGEEASFRVRIRNGGHLDISQLVLHIEGSQYGQVSLTAGGPYSHAVWPPGVDVNAMLTRTVGPFYFYADQATNGSSEILSVHISTFDVSLDHLLVDHTNHTAAANDSFSRVIYPD